MTGKNELPLTSEKKQANNAREKILQNMMELVLDIKLFVEISFVLPKHKLKSCGAFGLNTQTDPSVHALVSLHLVSASLHFKYCVFLYINSTE